MILYILVSYAIITIDSHHLSSLKNYYKHCFATNTLSNFNNHFPTKLNVSKNNLNLINNDEEFQGLIGYEATEKVKERLPSCIQNISKKLVKTIMEHDLDIINSKSDEYKPSWKIRKNKNRFDICYYKVGEKILGRVSKVFPTYALVDIGSTKYGVLHARDMSSGWVDRVDLTLTPKEDIHVYVKSINLEYNTIKLSLIPPTERKTDASNGETENKESKERHPLTYYDIEDVVEGIIVRKSPLGYYVDIGATVEGFLHISDLKITDRMRKSYSGKNFVDKSRYQIGSKLDKLYIKSINIIKNRIGLSENTLFEELERNVMTRKETVEQQSSYLKNYNLDFMKELRIRDIETMKLIGGYDDYLKKLKAKRNSSIDYLLYLENLQEQRNLEDEQKKLFKDLSTKQKIKRDQEYFNQLTHKICDLSDAAYEPMNDEKSVYRYGDNKVWTSDIYTPFISSEDVDAHKGQENDEEIEIKQKIVNKRYFKTLNKEILEGLKDVQGENFDLSEKYQCTNKYDEPHKLINYLYEEFHKKPSNLSEQKDKYEFKRGYIHSASYTFDNDQNSSIQHDGDALFEYDSQLAEELRLTQRSDMEEQMKKKEKFIDEMLSSQDPDVVELGEMLLETKDFDPFKHCPTFKESEESALRGARNLFKDDVLQWNDRAYNLIKDDDDLFEKLSQEAETILDSSPDSTENEKILDEEEIENIDPDVLKALEADEGTFTGPLIEGENDTGEFNIYKDDIGSDHEFQDELEDTQHESANQDLNTQNVEDNITPTTCEEDKSLLTKVKEHMLLKKDNSKINIQKMIKKLKRDKNLQRELLKTDSPLTTLLSSKSPNVGEEEDQVNKNRANDVINEIKKIVHKITDTPFTPSIANNKINTKEPVYSELDELKKYIFSKLDERQSISEGLEKIGQHPDTGSNLLFNKKDFKMLVKFAKQNLTPNDLSVLDKLENLNNNEYEDDRLMKILKSCYNSRKDENPNYRYYEQGYDQYLYDLEKKKERNEELKRKSEMGEMNTKLSVLMKNKNFLNMLKRLNVDPKKLTSANITQLLPQQYFFQRLTPSSHRNSSE